MQFKYRDFFNTNDDLNIIKEELSEGKLTSDQEKEVVELYVVKLMSTLDIAKKYQVSKGTISNILKRYNVPLRNPSEKALTPKEEEDVVELYVKQQMSALNIAKKYQVSDDTILRILKRNNVDIINPGHKRTLTSDQEKDVVNLYDNQKISSIEIAKQYGVSHHTILSILKRYNVPRRPPSEKALTPKEEEDVVDLYDNQKMSSIEIANQYGVSYGTILRTLRKNNIKIRDFSLAKILSQTKKSKDYLRKYHNTRNISGQGTSGTQTFDAGTPDNIGPSRPIAKRLGGHSPTT